MSFQAKQRLLKNVSNSLGSVLTAEQRDQVIDILNQHLQFFEIEEKPDVLPDTTTEELVEEFLVAKKLEGRSDATIAHYRYVIHRLTDNLKVPIQEISVFHIRSFLMSEKKRGISDNTLEGDRCVFSSFFGWLHKEELLKHNPCANLGPIKCAKKVKLPYSEVELEKLKESCLTSRDRALLSFLLCTGCRISEVCSLNRDAIDFQNLECVVYGKGAKERTVYLDSVTAMLLKRYLDDREDTEPALFVGKGTDRFKPNGVRAMLNKVAERAGVEHVHPHKFRRTLATNLIHRGMPIQEVASVLGHDQLDTTMTYVYLDKNNIRNSYRKYT